MSPIDHAHHRVRRALRAFLEGCGSPAVGAALCLAPLLVVVGVATDARMASKHQAQGVAVHHSSKEPQPHIRDPH